MISRPVPALLLGCCALLLAAPLSAATLLRQATLAAPAADGARLVLELSAAPERAPKVFALSAPERVVIDLPRTSLAPGAKLPTAAGPVRELRDGSRPGGTLRLVLELRQGMAWKTRTEGRSFIVELGRAPSATQAGPAPAASAAATPAATSPVRARHAPTDTGRDVIVAIDPGHGGKDPGSSGRGGTREKDVVLKISQALARRVDAEPGMRAYLTRNDDRFIHLEDRMKLARQAGADIFISVHADAAKHGTATGSSVFLLNERGASSQAAAWLAEVENSKSGGSREHDALDSVLVDLTQTASIAYSADVAARVLAQLDRVGNIRRVESANFAVLRSSRGIPAVLVETGFISTPAEEKKLRTPAHQQALADAIFNGVREYFRQSPPDGTWFARQREERQQLVADTP